MVMGNARHRNSSAPAAVAPPIRSQVILIVERRAFDLSFAQDYNVTKRVGRKTTW
jgi:hypothetical protein